MEKVNMHLSRQKEKFARQSIPTQVIQYPKLPIKDHSKINRKEEYSTTLVIPVKHFTDTLYKLGYLGIENILDKAKLN